AERDAILSALMALSLTSRQILHYSFCVQDRYSNYKIAREVGYSERSIQRMKSEALIEFAEAYRNGKVIAYK
ncbi:ArpU family transcriptional regulator, partial [Enterococcus faecalis PF3]